MALQNPIFSQNEIRELQEIRRKICLRNEEIEVNLAKNRRKVAPPEAPQIPILCAFEKQQLVDCLGDRVAAAVFTNMVRI